MKRRYFQWQLITYVVTQVLMIYSAYLHLTWGSSEIVKVRLTDLLAAWPVFVLILAWSLLSIAAIIWFFDKCRAARIAFWGGIFGLVYYSFAICAQFLIISYYVVILPKGFVGFVLPWLLTIVIVWRLNPRRICANQNPQSANA